MTELASSPRLKKFRVETQDALTVRALRGSLSAESTEVTLAYKANDANSIEERVVLEHVPAGFGGTRVYFRCPSQGCNQRVTALYFVNGLFRCRRCHSLAYASQCEDERRRAMRRADKARARLGYDIWRPFTRTPMARPKRMWRSKFWRLQGAALAHDYEAQKAFVTGLDNRAKPRAPTSRPGQQAPLANKRLRSATIRDAS